MFTERYSQPADEYIRKNRRSFTTDFRHRFKNHQCYEAIGDDKIPEIPYYILAGHRVKTTCPKLMMGRLNDWARYEPEGNDPNLIYTKYIQVNCPLTTSIGYAE